MNKLANPLNYPLAVLAGGILLVMGARVLKFPVAVTVPAAIAVAAGGSSALKVLNPSPLPLESLELTRELLGIRQSADVLAAKAKQLRDESRQLLGEDAFQVDLLAAVELACDRSAELPAKVDALGKRLRGKQSLLSAQELEAQLHSVEARLSTSSGAARQHLQKLATTLSNNIQLAQEGSDARQAQTIALATTIQESAGVLQQLQNQLRTADLSDREQVDELRLLSDELKGYQENVDFLVAG
ncbi:MAG: hypothetical protein AB4040_20835 [Synechococcus sp.]